jgi:hypothetical protein
VCVEFTRNVAGACDMSASTHWFVVHICACTTHICSCREWTGPGWQLAFSSRCKTAHEGALLYNVAFAAVYPSQAKVRRQLSTAQMCMYLNSDSAHQCNGSTTVFTLHVDISYAKLCMYCCCKHELPTSAGPSGGVVACCTSARRRHPCCLRRSLITTAAPATPAAASAAALAASAVAPSRCFRRRRRLLLCHRHCHLGRTGTRRPAPPPCHTALRGGAHRRALQQRRGTCAHVPAHLHRRRRRARDAAHQRRRRRRRIRRRAACADCAGSGGGVRRHCGGGRHGGCVGGGGRGSAGKAGEQ